MNWVFSEDGELINLDKIECIQVQAVDDPDVSFSHEVLAVRGDEGYRLAIGSHTECKAAVFNLSQKVLALPIVKFLKDES